MKNLSIPEFSLFDHLMCVPEGCIDTTDEMSKCRLSADALSCDPFCVEKVTCEWNFALESTTVSLVF